MDVWEGGDDGRKWGGMFNSICVQKYGHKLLVKGAINSICSSATNANDISGCHHQIRGGVVADDGAQDGGAKSQRIKSRSTPQNMWKDKNIVVIANILRRRFCALQKRDDCRGMKMLPGT